MSANTKRCDFCGTQGEHSTGVSSSFVTCHSCHVERYELRLLMRQAVRNSPPDARDQVIATTRIDLRNMMLRRHERELQTLSDTINDIITEVETEKQVKELEGSVRRAKQVIKQLRRS